MPADKREIAEYLKEVKVYIAKGRYTISTREKNRQLETDYILNEQIKRQIILDLKVEDFSHTLRNKHKGYEHEILYVFGKEINLLERFGNSTKQIALYIKFNKLENKYLIIISFHKQEQPLNYPFKST